MNKRFFKKAALILCTLLMVMQLRAGAQSTDNHFIYIQAKDKQPFYVILNSKVYSSSTIGYLIIPKLKNGTYTLKIGFPKQSADESVFKCVVDDADVGYSLQKSDNGNLGLLDLQTQNLIAAAGNTNNNSAAPIAATQNIVTNTAPATSSAFGDMLSSVSNDSTLNRQMVTQQPKAVMQQDAANGTSVQADNFGNNPQADAKAVIAASGQKNLKPASVSDDTDQTYGVIKSSENPTDAGQQMTFILFNSRSTDTVQIVVPQSAVQNNGSLSSPESSDTSTSKQAGGQYGDRSLALFKNSDGDTVFSDDSDSKNNVTKSSSGKRKHKGVHTLDGGVPAGTAATAAANNVNNPFYSGTSVNNSTNNTGNSNDADNDAAEVQQSNLACDNPLSDKELQKTQKKMISRGNDDDMLSIADKAIKGKCVTTQQVKQLGSLFLSDAGRFAIYQDAYPYVSDKDNYGSLQNQLLDTYFKNRLMEMLKKQ